MANSKKTKYPLDREKQSVAFAEDRVSTNVYSTQPSINISISGINDADISTDIQNAIDDVLKHHGK